VILNNNNEKKTVNLESKLFYDNAPVMTDLSGGKMIKAVNRTFKIDLKPYQIMILKMTKKRLNL